MDSKKPNEIGKTTQTDLTQDDKRAARRKILRGLAGVPFVATFGHHSNAAAASIIQCVNNVVNDIAGNTNADGNLSSDYDALNKIGNFYTDGTDWWSDADLISDPDNNPDTDDSYLDCTGTRLSGACFVSFTNAGGNSNAITKIDDCE